MSIDVFVSVGINSKRPEYEKFISEVEQFLRDNGLNPRTVGRSDFSSGQPLKLIEQVMNECSGTIVIAFERIHIEKGLDKRGSSAENLLSNVNIPTVWNQIEPSMAYVLGHPLLVIVQNGLRSEGLLETGYDWYVQWVDIDNSTLQKREFLGVFANWKKRVEEYKSNDKKTVGNKSIFIDPQQLTIAQIISSMKPTQLWAIIATLVTAIAAIAVAAYKIGTINTVPVKKASMLENTCQISKSSAIKNTSTISLSQWTGETHDC
jgi:hypothetical protein